MLSDQFHDLFAIAGVQRLVLDSSPWAICSALAAIAAVALVIDYGRMLWLRSKMVKSVASKALKLKLTRATAPRTTAVSHSRQYVHAPGHKTMDLV